jgi:hypothetical protein
MQTETIAKKDAEVAKKDAEVAQLRAEIARLHGEAPATQQPTQEPAPEPAKPASKKEPQSPARQRSAPPETAEVGSPLKRPPSLHVMAQWASALSPGRTRSSGGSPIPKRQIIVCTCGLFESLTRPGCWILVPRTLVAR